MIETNHPDSQSKLHDSTKIKSLLFISMILKIFKLFLIISNIVYFLCMLWYIFCIIEMDVINNNDKFDY